LADRKSAVNAYRSALYAALLRLRSSIRNDGTGDFDVAGESTKDR
jgi:hypothetical protein